MFNVPYLIDIEGKNKIFVAKILTFRTKINNSRVKPKVNLNYNESKIMSVIPCRDKFLFND